MTQLTELASRFRRPRIAWTSLAIVASLLAITATGCAHSSQQADMSFEPLIATPAFAAGEGPVVQIDEAHANFHTIDGRYAPFAKFLRRDGYAVQGLAESATAESLAQGDIYVISNALSESDVKGWKLPIESAFTPSEVAAIRTWVEGGRRPHADARRGRRSGCRVWRLFRQRVPL